MNELELNKKLILKKQSQLYYILNREKVLQKQKEYLKTHPRKSRAKREFHCPKCAEIMICIMGNQICKKYQCPICTDMWTLSKTGIKE